MPFDGTTIYDPIVTELQRGKENILKHGWCQHIRRDEKGRRCLLGAYVGQFTELHSNKALRAIAARVPNHYNHKNPNYNDWCNIAYWNNEEGRTKEEVLQLIDDTIADLVAAKI